MEIDEIKKLVESTSEQRLREIVTDWLTVNSEFRSFVETKLNPQQNEIDFDKEFAKTIIYEGYKSSSRNRLEILDWSNIYYYQIQPWAEKADSLHTRDLRNLIVAIISRVVMIIDDEDFYGDDWYGDDYSQDINSIIDTLGSLFGLLMIREDLAVSDLNELESLVIQAQKEDKIGNYLDTPYETMLELIRIRLESEEVSCELYDVMIKANFDHSAGQWICYKIDFIRSLDLPEEADSVMNNNLQYPEVCLKLYNELIERQRWDEAIALIDRAQEIKGNINQWRNYSINPNWLAMKQSLLMQHGSKEAQISNLSQLFHQSLGEEKREYYNQLKQLVPTDDWKRFYTELLSDAQGVFALDGIGEFLIIEKELDWLYRLISEKDISDKTDYRTPLKYAPYLMSTHSVEMRAMLVRTFKEYAASRFGYKKKVKSGKYYYFCNDLRSLTDIGAYEELQALIEYFKENYRTRPTLMSELRRVSIDSGV